jgi:excinuclease ABC subunit B
VRYLHSDVDTLERVEILRDLRRGEFDVLIGINLLREGLDLPEVSLVAILDADKEGFLRSPRSLIQTIGRAARNVRGHVVMYADRVTDAMKHAIGETNRRRALQEDYNKEHGITPATVVKAILDMSPTSGARDYYAVPKGPPKTAAAAQAAREAMDIADQIEALRQEMFAAAENLEFEKAARLRDQLRTLKASQGVDDLAPVEATRPGRSNGRGSPPGPSPAAGRRAGGGASAGRARGRNRYR